MIGWSIGITFMVSFCVLWWQMEAHREETTLGAVSSMILAISVIAAYVYLMVNVLAPAKPPEIVKLDAGNWSCSHERFVPHHTENGGKTNVPDGYICDQWSLK